MLLCNKYPTVYTIAIYQVSNGTPTYIVLLVQQLLASHVSASAGNLTESGFVNKPWSRARPPRNKLTVHINNSCHIAQLSLPNFSYVQDITIVLGAYSLDDRCCVTDV